VIGVLFSMQNFDPVPVYFFSGKAVSIRLIFVIAISGVMGYLLRHFYGIAREDQMKRQIQHLLKRKTPRGKFPPSKPTDPNDSVWVSELDED